MAALLIFSISANSYAQVISLPQGIKAPYTGILFPVEKAQTMQIELMELDKYKELANEYDQDKVLYKKSIDYEEKKVNTLLDQNDKLIQQVKKSEGMTTWEKVAFFGLGAVATIAAGIGFAEASKAVNK